jgi:hypothetical protein
MHPKFLFSAIKGNKSKKMRGSKRGFKKLKRKLEVQFRKKKR